MNEEDALALAVGRVVKPHGVQGELVVEIRTDSPEERFAPGSVLGVVRPRRSPGRGQIGTEGRGRPGSVPASVTVLAARPHSGRLLMRVEGVESRDAAEALRGAVLTVSSEELEPAEDPDEFHDFELEGLRVVRVGGAEVGVVGEVLHTPAGELLSVRTPHDREVLVPFVAEIVPEVDLAAGQLVVDPPEGLLDPA